MLLNVFPVIKIQLKDTESTIKNKSRVIKDTESTIKNNSKVIDLRTQLKGFNFMTTLVSVFKNIKSKDITKYHTFYSSSNPEIIIYESDIDDVFLSIYTTITSNKQKSLGKVQTGLLIQSFSYIKLRKEFHYQKGID